jgi:predicted  nucleic acid-binding Zn-ribbon protein
VPHVITEQSRKERLQDVDQRIADIRKAMGASLGQNALQNLSSELERLQAERDALKSEAKDT